MFVACTSATDPKVWPSSRWTGFEGAVDWMGLLDCIHGLLTRTFVAWSGSKGHEVPDHIGDVKVPQFDGDADGMQAMGGHGDLPDPEAAQEQHGGGGGGPADPADPAKADDKRTAEAKHVSEGRKWLLEDSPL
eukprot:9490738-Pyramimonas_sp.AAC.2